MSTRTDVELLDAWRAGDDVSGNELVRRHIRRVYRFFRTKVDEGIDDLTQETFRALVQARDRFRHQQGDFGAYLFGIARMQLLMHLRGRGRAARVFSPADASVAELRASTLTSPSAMAARGEEQRLLLAALRTIPVDFQIAVELHYWEGLSVEEIARVIEVPSGTVKSRLSRARALLQERIEALSGKAPAELDDWVTSVGQAFGKPED